MKVFIYRNLNRKGVVWSVKEPRTGLVIDRATTVYLSQAEFKVSQAGRERVLEQGRKNVHAGVAGKRIKKAPPNLNWQRVKYNPYKYKTFIYDHLPYILAVTKAKYVKLTKNGCFVSNGIQRKK